MKVLKVRKFMLGTSRKHFTGNEYSAPMHFIILMKLKDVIIS